MHSDPNCDIRLRELGGDLTIRLRPTGHVGKAGQAQIWNGNQAFLKRDLPQYPIAIPAYRLRILWQRRTSLSRGLPNVSLTIWRCFAHPHNETIVVLRSLYARGSQ